MSSSKVKWKLLRVELNIDELEYIAALEENLLNGGLADLIAYNGISIDFEIPSTNAL